MLKKGEKSKQNVGTHYFERKRVRAGGLNHTGRRLSALMIAQYLIIDSLYSKSYRSICVTQALLFVSVKGLLKPTQLKSFPETIHL